MVMIGHDALALAAAGITWNGNSWSISAPAAAGQPMLLKGRTRYIDNETHLVVAGHVTRGGLVIGLRKGDTWVIRRSVADAGDFAAIMAPLDSGEYAVAVASDPAAGADVTAILNRIALVPPMRPAK